MSNSLISSHFPSSSSSLSSSFPHPDIYCPVILSRKNETSDSSSYLPALLSTLHSKALSIPPSLNNKTRETTYVSLQTNIHTASPRPCPLPFPHLPHQNPKRAPTYIHTSGQPKPNPTLPYYHILIPIPIPSTSQLPNPQSPHPNPLNLTHARSHTCTHLRHRKLPLLLPESAPASQPAFLPPVEIAPSKKSQPRRFCHPIPSRPIPCIKIVQLGGDVSQVRSSFPSSFRTIREMSWFPFRGSPGLARSLARSLARLCTREGPVRSGFEI